MPLTSKSDTAISLDDFFDEALDGLGLLLANNRALYAFVVEILRAVVKSHAGRALRRSDLERLRRCFFTAVDAGSSQ